MADNADEFDNADAVDEFCSSQHDISKESDGTIQSEAASKRQEEAAYAKRVTGRELTEQELNLWIAQMDQLGDL